jgi:hypothetical protein
MHLYGCWLVASVLAGDKTASLRQNSLVEAYKVDECKPPCRAVAVLRRHVQRGVARRALPFLHVGAGVEELDDDAQEAHVRGVAAHVSI